MSLLIESPWYKHIERQAEIRTSLGNIQMSLEVKFGNPGSELMTQISEISDLERLTEIFRATLTANRLEEVHQILPQNNI